MSGRKTRGGQVRVSKPRALFESRATAEDDVSGIQGTLSGAWSANTTKKREQATGEQAVAISIEATADASELQVLVAERCDTLRTDYMERYRKGNTIDWCMYGDQFVAGIEELEGLTPLARFPGWVTQDLATIMRSHDKHDTDSLSLRAAAVLDRILCRQPPVTVHKMASNRAASERMVLHIAPTDVQPWLPLTTGSGAAGPSTILQPTRGAGAVAAAAAADMAPRTGLRALLPLAQSCRDLLLEAFENPEEADAVVKKHKGDYLLLEYLLTAFSLDLGARLQVTHSHLSKVVQLSSVQRVLADSLLHRALLLGASGDFKRLIDVLAETVTKRAEQRAQDAQRASRLPSSAGVLCEALCSTATEFLGQIFDLLGAMEDSGCFAGSACVTLDVSQPRLGLRCVLDEWLAHWVKNHLSEPAVIDRLLAALPQRDRMRLVSAILGVTYHRFDFKEPATCNHGSQQLLRFTETLGVGTTTLKPATGADCPPAHVLAILTHPDLWNKFVRTLSIDNVLILVMHICLAASLQLPTIVKEQRFVLTGAAPRHLQINAPTGAEFMETHHRFETPAACTDTAAAVRAEFRAMLDCLDTISTRYVKIKGAPEGTDTGCSSATPSQDVVDASSQGVVDIDVPGSQVSQSQGSRAPKTKKTIETEQALYLIIARKQLEAADKRLAL